MSDDLKLHLIKGFHTLVVALSTLAVIYIFYCAFLKTSWHVLLGIAMAYPLAICIGRLLNGRECILQTWAKKLQGIEEGWAPDIYFLGQNLALRVVVVTAIFYVIAILFYAFRVML